VYTRNCIESSNLSFTAKFDVTRTPDFERNQGFCGFWVSGFRGSTLAATRVKNARLAGCQFASV
jgi:hypothetical protein